MCRWKPGCAGPLCLSQEHRLDSPQGEAEPLSPLVKVFWWLALPHTPGISVDTNQVAI